MDISQLIRDVPRVLASLRELPDESLITLTGCKIYCPVRFSERSLASVGSETYIVGIYAMVVEDKYFAASIVNAMVQIDPILTNKVSIDGDEYYEFVFTPGSVVTPSLQLIQTNTLVYRVYDELISKGRVPWYLGYKEMARIFDTAKKHAGANIGQDHEVTEIMISMISRDPKDRTRYFRQAVTEEGSVLKAPAFIPLKSVVYGATNTMNKLAGSYMQDGIVSALVSPADRSERIESLLMR